MARKNDETHPRQGRGGRPYISTSGAVLNRSVTWSAIPDDEAFGDAEFLEAPHLSELADRLIQEYDELSWLAEHEVRYLWKRTGGKKSQKATLGKTILTSGLVHYFGLATWVIWLGADWCRELEFNADKVEALLYHEMLHPTLKESEDPGKDPKPAVRAHDFEGFASEIRRYGFWEADLVTVKNAVQGRLQMELA